MKGYDVVLVNYKEKVFIPLSRLRELMQEFGDAYVIMQKPFEPGAIPVSSYMDLVPNENDFIRMRASEILASDDFEEVCVPRPALRDTRNLYHYHCKELKRIKDRLGVNLITHLADKRGEQYE